MSNGGVVLVYKHEGSCDSGTVIGNDSKGGLLGWVEISDGEVVDESRLEETVAGIGVTSDGVVVSDKDSTCKEVLLVGQGGYEANGILDEEEVAWNIGEDSSEGDVGGQGGGIIS